MYEGGFLMSKYCTACGTQLDDEASFCSKCGTKIVDVEKIPFENNEKTKEKKNITTKKLNVKNLLVFLITAILISIIALCVVIKPNNTLPTVDNFEKRLSSAVKSYYSEVEGNKENIILDSHQDSLGKMHYSYGSDIDVSVHENDGTITWVTSSISFSSPQPYDEEFLDAMSSIMITAGLYSNKYNDYESLCELRDYILNYGQYDRYNGEINIKLGNITYSLWYDPTSISFSILPPTDGKIEHAELKIDFTQEELYDIFCGKAEGIWVDKNSCSKYGNNSDDVSFSFAAFEDGNFCTGGYPGGFSRIGKIVEVEQEENAHTITLFYSEEEYLGDYYPEEYVDKKVVFVGDYFYFEDSPEIHYSYMGYELEFAKYQVAGYCEELAQRGVAKYIGLTAKDVFDDFGCNYEIGFLNGGTAFYYPNDDNGFEFKYLDYNDWNLTPPREESIIIEIMAGSKGDEICYGVKIGDSLDVIKEKIGISDYDGVYTAYTYMPNYKIQWTVDPTDQVTLAAFITIQQGANNVTNDVPKVNKTYTLTWSGGVMVTSQDKNTGIVKYQPICSNCGSYGQEETQRMKLSDYVEWNCEEVRGGHFCINCGHITNYSIVVSIR